MNNVKKYIEGLNKSMTRKEKLFFLNKVKLNSYDFIVDFGCANGRLLYEVDKKLKPKTKTTLLGVENNLQIRIDYAYEHKFERVQHLYALPLYKMRGAKVLLILSSVLHEIDEKTFDNLVAFANIYAKTVCVRDMCFMLPNRLYKKEEKKTDVFFQNLDCIDFFSTAQNIMLASSLSDNSLETLYEFFLKYTYKENWETEDKEQYFSVNVSYFYYKLASAFSIKYMKHYILPYKKKQVYCDFGYKMHAKTHIKYILEKRPKSSKIKWIKRQLRK